MARGPRRRAETRDRTGDLQTLSQLSYRGSYLRVSARRDCPDTTNFASDWRSLCFRALGLRTCVILDKCNLAIVHQLDPGFDLCLPRSKWQSVEMQELPGQWKNFVQIELVVFP
jgi:hypothetical protein